MEQLDEDGQVDFKGKAKAFVRTYGFLVVDPAVHQRGVGEALDLPELPDPEAARAEGGGPLEGHPRSHRHGQLPRREEGGDEDRAAGRGRRDRAGADRRAAATSPSRSWTGSRNILKTFNDQFGNIAWTDADRVHKLITEDIPPKVAADTAYQNAKQNSDKQNARIEHDKALARVMTALLKDDTELFKQFMRQRVVQALADGHGVRADVRTARGGRPNRGPVTESSQRRVPQLMPRTVSGNLARLLELGNHFARRRSWPKAPLCSTPGQSQKPDKSRDVSFRVTSIKRT